jgi:hypothetical protein
MGKLARELSAAREENLASVEEREALAAAEDEGEGIVGDAPDRPFKPSEWRWNERQEAMVNTVTGEVLDCDAFAARMQDAAGAAADRNPFDDDDFAQVARPKTGSSGGGKGRAVRR